MSERLQMFLISRFNEFSRSRDTSWALKPNNFTGASIFILDYCVSFSSPSSYGLTVRDGEVVGFAGAAVVAIVAVVAILTLISQNLIINVCVGQRRGR